MKKLFYDHFGLIFCKLSVWSCFEMRMQAFASSIFHHKVNVFDSVDAFMQLNYIGMFKLWKNLDFSDCLLFSLQVQKLVSIVLLHSHPLSRLLMSTLLNLSVGTFPNLRAQLVIVNLGAPWRGELIIEEHRATWAPVTGFLIAFEYIDNLIIKAIISSILFAVLICVLVFY